MIKFLLLNLIDSIYLRQGSLQIFDRVLNTALLIKILNNHKMRRATRKQLGSETPRGIQAFPSNFLVRKFSVNGQFLKIFR